MTREQRVTKTNNMKKAKPYRSSRIKRNENSANHRKCTPQKGRAERETKISTQTKKEMKNQKRGPVIVEAAKRKPISHKRASEAEES